MPCVASRKTRSSEDPRLAVKRPGRRGTRHTAGTPGASWRFRRYVTRRSQGGGAGTRIAGSTMPCWRWAHRRWDSWETRSTLLTDALALLWPVSQIYGTSLDIEHTFA